ncbi:DMT family transporter [Carnimonas nigrificans]|uniref:DMT family transporter n=1 Tax=Carnimonas nigrificans TaxID=64323 RepID=UPI0004B0FD14|nr:multidrug efflux SMR transporter [Carnimonas nigrificans]
MLSNKSLSTGAAWGFLFSAVIMEVVGTSFMTLSAREDALWGYAIMAAAIAISYFLLSQSVRVLPLGLAYAIWEGLGLALIALVGFLGFGEALSLAKVAGFLLAVGGIVMISSGE